MNRSYRAAKGFDGSQDNYRKYAFACSYRKYECNKDEHETLTHVAAFLETEAVYLEAQSGDVEDERDR